MLTLGESGWKVYGSYIYYLYNSSVNWKFFQNKSYKNTTLISEDNYGEH